MTGTAPAGPALRHAPSVGATRGSRPAHLPSAGGAHRPLADSSDKGARALDPHHSESDRATKDHHAFQTRSHVRGPGSDCHRPGTDHTGVGRHTDERLHQGPHRKPLRSRHRPAAGEHRPRTPGRRRPQHVRRPPGGAALPGRPAAGAGAVAAPRRRWRPHTAARLPADHWPRPGRRRHSLLPLRDRDE